jgi:DNA replication protein DnaC
MRAPMTDFSTKSSVRSLSDVALRRSGIGRRYWSAHLDRDTVPLVVSSWVSDLPSVAKRGWGLFLFGANGVGKTHLASAVLLECLKHPLSVLFVTAEKLRVAAVEKTLWDPETDERQTLVDRASRVDVLVIDDLGKEYQTDSGWSQLVIENLLRDRVQNLRATILTSNLTPTEFRGRYHDSSLGLAQESMLVQEITGKNRRAEAASEERKRLLKHHTQNTT